jgi:hypothetical protein
LIGPANQFAKAGGGRRNRVRTQQPATLIMRGSHVQFGMGIHPKRHLLARLSGSVQRGQPTFVLAV